MFFVAGSFAQLSNDQRPCRSLIGDQSKNEAARQYGPDRLDLLVGALQRLAPQAEDVGLGTAGVLVGRRVQGWLQRFTAPMSQLIRVMLQLRCRVARAPRR